MANLKAELLIKVATQGAERLDALAKASERLGQRASKAANDTDAKHAASMSRMEMRLRKFAAQERARQERQAAQAEKTAAREAAAAERAGERRARAAERAAERERRSAITVENEMAKLERLQQRRAARAEARERLGLGGGASVMAGHGFTSRLRQGLGLARDLTVAGMGLRYGVQAAAGLAGEVMDPLRQYQTLLVQMRNKGVSAADLPGVDAAIRASARGGQFSPTQQAQAGVELAAAGITSAPAMQAALPSVMRLAQSGGLETGQAATALVDTAAQFGMHAQDFERIGDALKGAADASTVGVEDLTNALKYVGPIASKSGFDLEFVAGTIALLGENGLKGEQGGTAFRRMLTSLVHPAKQAKAALGALGLSPDDLKKGLGSPEKFQQFFRDLQKRMGARKMDVAHQEEMLKLLFGEEGITAGMILMKASLDDGAQGWASYTDQVRKSEGAMAQAADRIGNTLDGKMAHLNSTIETAKITLGEKFIPTLDRLIPKLAEAANHAADWIGQFSPDQVAGAAGTGLEVVGAGVASVLAAKIAAAFASEGVVGAMTLSGTTLAGTFMAAFGSALAGWKVGGIIAERLGIDVASGERSVQGQRALRSPAEIAAAEAKSAANKAASLGPLNNEAYARQTAANQGFTNFGGAIEIQLTAPKGIGAEVTGMKADKPLRLGVNVRSQ